MTTPLRTTTVSDWTAPSCTAGEFTVWPAHKRIDPSIDRGMRDRLSIAIYTGASCTSLRPTIAEATALIEALEWAVAHSEEVPA